MKLVSLFMTAVTVIAFGGCVIRGPEVRVKPPVQVDAGSGSKFCPPGQAKKGNC